MRACRLIAASAAFEESVIDMKTAILVICVLALMPAAPAGAIVGGQLDGTGHPYVGFLDASPIGRPDGPTGVLISSTVLLTAGHVTQSFAANGLTHPPVTFEPNREHCVDVVHGHSSHQPELRPIPH
jgi:hypothetical protein